MALSVYTQASQQHCGCMYYPFTIYQKLEVSCRPSMSCALKAQEGWWVIECITYQIWLDSLRRLADHSVYVPIYRNMYIYIYYWVCLSISTRYPLSMFLVKCLKKLWDVEYIPHQMHFESLERVAIEILIKYALTSSKSCHLIRQLWIFIEF